MTIGLDLQDAVHEGQRAALVQAEVEQTFFFDSIAPGLSAAQVEARCTGISSDTRHFDFYWQGVFIARGRAFTVNGVPRCNILD